MPVAQIWHAVLAQSWPLERVYITGLARWTAIGSACPAHHRSVWPRSRAVATRAHACRATGAISDSSQSRYRRRFFIAGSAVFVIISTLFVAYARELATLFSSLSGLGDWDPREEERIRSIAIVIGVTGFYVLDFSLNGLQASLRALILDQSPSHMQNVANAWHGRMTHIGNVLGYFAGYIDLAHWSGIKWVGGGQFRKLAVISCMFMAICVLVTCWTQVEDEALSDVVGTDSTGRRGTAVQWRKAWTNIRDTIKDLPVPVRRVCYGKTCPGARNLHG